MGPRRKKPPAQADPDASSSEGEDDQGGRRKRHRRGGCSGAGAGGLVSSFFQHQGVVGSKRTLADLQLDAAVEGGGEEDTLRTLLQQLPERHPNEKAALRRRHHAQFGRWWAQMRAGNSLLLYGLGSKYDLLNRFAREQTGDGACFTINGLHPGVTAKQIVQWATASLKQTKPSHYRGCTKDDMFELIRKDERRVYVVLHNIDGPGLRDHAAQHMLSELASLPNVHLAASVDHASAALLWNQQTRDRFSWVWHGVTNYAPYFREVNFAAIPSLLVGRSEQCSKQSATVVLASLSHSAREVFRLIADAQLDASAGEQGISFTRLFQRCRERFLVSNEMLLKAFLTEFKDHELLQTKRGGDGSDLLHIPLSEEVLQQVLQDVEAMG